MLSPKMQRTIRVNENQLMMLSERAHYDHSLAGYLYKRTSDSSRWQLRWFVLYQNILFYYDNDTCHRPSGVVLLEGCYCERLITTSLGGGAHSATVAHPIVPPAAGPDRHNMFSEVRADFSTPISINIYPIHTLDATTHTSLSHTM